LRYFETALVELALEVQGKVEGIYEERRVKGDWEAPLLASALTVMKRTYAHPAAETALKATR
jgi:hypothetical protein